jgi:hypothetical protein
MPSISSSDAARAAARAFWAGCCAASACDLAAHLLKSAPLTAMNFHNGATVSGEVSAPARAASIAAVALASTVAACVGGGRQRALAWALGVTVGLEALVLAGLGRAADVPAAAVLAGATVWALVALLGPAPSGGRVVARLCLAPPILLGLYALLHALVGRNEIESALLPWGNPLADLHARAGAIGTSSRPGLPLAHVAGALAVLALAAAPPWPGAGPAARPSVRSLALALAGMLAVLPVSHGMVQTRVTRPKCEGFQKTATEELATTPGLAPGTPLDEALRKRILAAVQRRSPDSMSQPAFMRPSWTPENPCPWDNYSIVHEVRPRLKCSRHGMAPLPLLTDDR